MLAVATVTVVAPVTPLLVAEIVAVPADTPLTSPTDETVATAGALDDHVIGAVITRPLPSSAVAINWTDAPTVTFNVDDETVIRETTATGVVGVSAVFAPLHDMTPNANVIANNARHGLMVCILTNREASRARR